MAMLAFFSTKYKTLLNSYAMLCNIKAMLNRVTSENSNLEYKKTSFLHRFLNNSKINLIITTFHKF